MKADLYLKVVLTVIAIALCAIAVQLTGSVWAVGVNCGTSGSACHVRGYVEVVDNLENHP